MILKAPSWFSLAHSDVAPSVSETVIGLVLPLCSLTRLSFVCQPKDNGPDQYTTCQVVLRFCSSGTALVTPNLKYAINVLGSIYGSFFRCLVIFILLLPLATWLASSHVLPGDVVGSGVKYNIPRDLHPRLPPSDLVMSELPDDAIRIYQRPLGLNKVITFEIMFRSLQIEPIVTLFRIFQMLCKQGHWFFFAKRRAPTPICIDDNRSCMKGWKTGLFFIDRKAILDYMSWMRPNLVITDPKPPAGSYNQSDVRRLSASVVKLRDMPKGVLVLSGLSRVQKSRTCDPILRDFSGNIMGIHDFLCLPEWTGSEVQEEIHHDMRPTLQRLPFYCTPPAADDAAIRAPTLEDLVAATLNTKVLAKAEASNKRRASTFGSALSQVAKRTKSATAQSSKSFARTNLFNDNDSEDDESDDDDDACVEIPLITPICSAATISLGSNHGGGSIPPAAEGPSNLGSQGKVLMDDAADTPSESAGYFFPFVHGPYYVEYPKDDIITGFYEDPRVCKTVVDQFPTPGEMVRIEALTDDGWLEK
ncbi:hypothetical protein Tco_0641108 [Tanacetum coccineum]